MISERATSLDIALAIYRPQYAARGATSGGAVSPCGPVALSDVDRLFATWAEGLDVAGRDDPLPLLEDIAPEVE